MRLKQTATTFSVPQIARMNSTTDFTDDTDSAIAAEVVFAAISSSVQSVSSVVSLPRHRRRDWIAGWLLNVVVAMLAVVRCAESSASAASQPDIVMIISDGQVWGEDGFMGHPAIRTPHLGKFAAESLTLQAGPAEEKNLADVEKERVEKMRVKLDAWWKGQGNVEPTIRRFGVRIFGELLGR